MPTPAEQKALAFVALVILLGGAVRVVRAVRGGALELAGATATGQEALDRQARSADSAAAADRERMGARGRNRAKGARKRRDDGAISTTGVANESAVVTLDARGFPPPGPRIDVGVRADARLPAAPLVDLDVAGVAEIERLPWVGPALARRIVASRDSLGPFGVLPALGRVKGVGPATLRRLAPLVTFSGQERR